MQVVVAAALAAMLAAVLAAVPAEAQANTYTHPELSGYDQTRQETARQMLDRAVAAFALDPATALAQIQDTSNPLYHDGELYVFVLDKSNVMVAHGVTPELVGVDIYTLIDDRGANIGELFMESRSPYGKWVEYWWPNPATETGESERKITWAKTYGEHQFAVGMYPGTPGEVSLEDVDVQTQRIIYNMVDTAIAAFAADRDSAMAAIQDPDNRLYHDGELYVFVHNHEAAVLVAHGIRPDQVGSNSYNYTDIRGTNLGELILDNRSPYGKWHEYWWPNPATETDEEERKVAWVKSHGGHIFGVGAYPDAHIRPDTLEDLERQETAWQMALNAAEAFHADPASAMAAIQDPENRLYHDGELYVTVLDDDGTIVAHGTSPELVGAQSDNLNDTRGTNLGDIFRENRSPYGKWVEYWWPNPATETGEGERKLAIMVERGGYVFKVGIYPGADSTYVMDAAESEKRRIAKAMVETAIEAYADDRVSANKAIADTSNPLYHDGELYVFVLDMNGTIVEHGVTPGLVGVSMYDLIDVQGTNLGELFMENRSAYGTWHEYWWPNPATETDEPELKKSWAKDSSGYIFAVGLYP